MTRPLAGSSSESSDSWKQAGRSWRLALGEERVLWGPERTRRYGLSTTGVRRRIPLVLVPGTRTHVVSLVQIASEFRVPLYPISRGHNWGYGAANPVVDNCVIVDLSQMNRIVHLDEQLGLVTVEPGVTQQQLREYLDETGASFYLPVHGGGPDCSLLGNALERGYGLTPYADHFAALTSLEAVLPNGSVYRGALGELGGDSVQQAFKWGIGPYMDGLFTQGNFGIVTQATIALAPVAEHVQAFIFAVRSNSYLERAVLAVQEVLRRLGGLCSSINLMNDLRVLSMITAYPDERGPVSEAKIEELAGKHDVTPWTGAGALYGEPRILRAARAVIRRELKHCVRRVVFFDQRQLSRWNRWLQWIPLPAAQRFRQNLGTAHEFLGVVCGRPQQTALPLAYWKSGRTPDTSIPLDPAADGCGLIWYSPLVPMKPNLVRQYADMVKSACRHHGLDSLITLTSLNDRVFDSTVPLLFRADDDDESQRAHGCYLELLDRGRQAGFVPYRVGVQHMESIIDPQAACWQLVNRIKQAVDPHDIIAPGRYAPTARREE